MRWQPPAYDPRVEIRDLLPQDGWRRAMQEICSRHAIEFSNPTPLPTGTDVVWAVADCVVKLGTPAWSWQIDAEARALDQVAGKLSVQTPALLARGELGGWPYLVMSRLSGAAIGSVWPRLDGLERGRLAAELGRLTRELHQLPVPRHEVAWGEFWRECRKTLGQRNSGDGVPDALAAQVQPFLESVGELRAETPVFLHTELLDQHVWVERQSGRFVLSGLIDFADHRAGPAEYEFPAPVEFLFRAEPGLLRQFLLAYGLPPGKLTPAYSERLLAWGLSHRYGQLARMLRVVHPLQPASLSELARALYGVA